MTYSHKSLASGRWFTFSLSEQLAHIGSEVGRAFEEQDSLNAKERAIELIDLSLADKRWRGRYRELARLREVFCDSVFGENTYDATPSFFDEYFFAVHDPRPKKELEMTDVL